MHGSARGSGAVARSGQEAPTGTSAVPGVAETRPGATRPGFLANPSTDLIAVMGPDGRFVSVSRSVVWLLGWSRAEFLALPWQDLVAAADHEAVAGAIEAGRRGALMSVEATMRTGIGAARRMSLLLTSADGPFLSVVGRPSRAAKSTVPPYDLILSDAPVPVIVHRGGQVLLANRAAARLLGAPSGGLVARGALSAFVHPDDRARFERRAANLELDGGRLPPTSVRLLRADAVPLVVEALSSRVGPDVGAVVVTILRDVTSKRVAEHRQEAQRRWFRALTKYNADLIVVVDADGTVRYANRSADDGEGPEVRVGEGLGADVHPDDLGRVEAMLSAVRSSPGVPQTVRYRAYGPGDGLSWLEAVGIDHRADPDVQGIIVGVRDVTERERSAAALRERTEELESLTFAMTHDLKTPLASMDWLLDELEEHGLARGPPRDIVGRLRANIAAMDALVRDLLQFARVGQRTDRVPVDLAAIVERVVATVEGAARASQVRIVWERADLPVLMADETYLFQVFLNLLDNAVKYGRDGGSVRIRGLPFPAATRAKWWRVVVDDDGPGIPEEYLERIFRPFERAPDPDGRVLPGTGVGLAIARKVARHYGGDLVASNRPEGGARFVLDLPYTMVRSPQRM